MASGDDRFRKFPCHGWFGGRFVRSCYLPWMSLASVASVGFALVIAGVGGSPAASPAGSARSPKSSGLPPADSSDRHYVTLDQLTETARSAQGSMADLQAVAHNRGAVSFGDLSGGRPVVLVFVKQGCPCSVEFQPVFNRLAQALEGQVQVVGVIDGTVEVARKYAAANDVPYSILADAERIVIGRFEAKNAAYVALVEMNGTVHTLWPGCSASMLQDLCRKSAALSGRDNQAVEFAEMPAALTTGCPFQP
jgi:peroxiredoxin